MTIITAWRRDPEKYEALFKDLREQGWSEDRMEAIKFATMAFPNIADVVRFYAKEAFEPDMIERYGLLDELPPYEGTYFEQLGVPKDVAEKYWISHWLHPAFGEVTKMLHRGLITEQDVWEWYRVMEIPPAWREKLTKISWNLPNRIELRMMARYGLVDKDFLLEQLKQVGLQEEFRDVAADMMLAMGIRTDLSTRFSKGWLNAEQVAQELVDSGLSEDVRKRMYQWIVKNAQPERVLKERDLTLSDVYKGFKNNVIGYEQAKSLIMDMGFDEWEAEYKLEVNVGALAGSPETYMQLKRLTELYKRSQGQEAKIPPLELIQAEKDVIEAELALKQVEAKEKTDITEAEAREAVESAKIAYHKLLHDYSGEA